MQNGARAAATGDSSSFTERRLFEDGQFFHAGWQGADSSSTAARDAPSRRTTEFPFVLLTGRGTSAQWHTGSRTGKSDVLRKLAPQDCYVEINPRGRASGWASHRTATVRVVRAAARLAATAFVTATVQPGQVFIPMHYAATNQLTLAVFDPYSRQPSYKACAVRLQPGSRG